MLSHLGLVDVPTRAHPSRVGGGPWCRDAGPRVSRAGILAPGSRPGIVLQPGQPLAEVRTLTGVVLERILAPGPCFVVSLPECTSVEPGDTTCTLAVRESRVV